ncbi:glucan endo-1,3-beta-glucosidase [Prosopis cineraria]|uniref:glucan endo-1,3-beta-glucosidase n=1 Tax=Prosopis cineraria TaxID=364024 RepID=UPI00240F03B5|nr:glucan endo-1,3-beta-glucosidase [Prosopis cineraria]
MLVRFSSFISLFLLSLLPLVPSLPCFGVTYSSPSNSSHPRSHPPFLLPAAIHSLNLASLRLEDSDPSIIRSFLYTNVSLFLTIPNYLVPPIAANRSAALSWLYVHVVPFYPRAKISTISVGNDFVDASPDSVDQLLPAIRNLHLSLRDLGIRKISVSTSFSFVSAISTPFPPSAAQFREPPGDNVIGPLLRFLRDTNSSFLINVYPYNLYRLRSEIPIGIALFQEHAFNFRDDVTTGVRYYNLFDMMIDAVVSAMAVAGYENIPIIVTETGWPSASSTGNEADANKVYAEIYLKGLVKHLKSGKGTPLRKEGLSEVYIYELFDKEPERGKHPLGRSWGILYPNLTMKYHHIDFSGSSTILGAKAWIKMAVAMSSPFLLVVCL